jgi:hypothetical protein
MTQFVRPFRKSRGVNAVLLQEGRIAEHDGLAIDDAKRALAEGRFEVGDRRNGDALFVRRSHNCQRKGMFRRLLDASVGWASRTVL